MGFNQTTGLVSPLRRQICLNPVWLGGLRSFSFAALSLGPFGLATRALRAHPPNWIQTNLAPRGETKPVGLIESVGAPPKTPGRLRRKNVAGGSAPRPPLGLRPNPRSGGGLGWEPSAGSGAQPQRGSGGRAPSYILAAMPPRGLGRSPSRSGPCPLATPRRS